MNPQELKEGGGKKEKNNFPFSAFDFKLFCKYEIPLQLFDYISLLPTDKTFFLSLHLILYFILHARFIKHSEKSESFFA